MFILDIKSKTFFFHNNWWINITLKKISQTWNFFFAHQFGNPAFYSETEILILSYPDYPRIKIDNTHMFDVHSLLRTLHTLRLTSVNVMMSLNVKEISSQCCRRQQ